MTGGVGGAAFVIYYKSFGFIRYQQIGAHNFAAKSNIGFHKNSRGIGEKFLQLL